MRLHPLKFRAWHKPTKKMFPVYGFNDDFVWENSMDGPDTSETLPASRVDCVIMQSTCLLDKNKKEVYEGDIVRAAWMHHGKPGQPFNAVIIYNEDIGQYQISYKNIDGGFASDQIYFRYEVEVIGNLAENSELMN